MLAPYFLGYRGRGKYWGVAGGGTADGGFEQEPVVIDTTASGNVTVSGKVKPGSFGKFVYPIAVVTAGRQYTFKLTPHFSQLAMQGKLAMTGFGFKNGNDFHMVGLRGDGSTGLKRYQVHGTPPNGWNKETGHTTVEGAAPTNGTQAGPNWLRLIISADGATYTLRSSADEGVNWSTELSGQTPTPFTNVSQAPTFGIALWFNNLDAGPFSIDITQILDAVITTLNSSDKNSELTLSNGNLTVTKSGATVAWQGVRSTTSKSSGKYYVEVTIDNETGASGTEPMGFGIANSTWPLTNESYLGVDTNSIGFYQNNMFAYFNVNPMYSSFTFMTGSGAPGNVYGIGVDLDDKVVYLKSDFGSVMNIGMPLTGTINSATMAAGPYFFALVIRRQNAAWTANFGTTAFTMAVPRGFSPWDSITPSTACAWSDIAKKHILVSGGNFETCTTASAGGTPGVTTRIQSTTTRSTGKYYCEFFVDQIIIAGTNRSGVGLSSPQDNLAGGIGGTWAVGYYDNGLLFQNNASAGTIETWTTNDRVCMAADLDNKKVWFRKNANGWQNDVIGNQNPATNTGGIDISSWFTSGHVVGPTCSFNPGSGTDGTCTCNFGRTAFTHTAPSGFVAWPST